MKEKKRKHVILKLDFDKANDKGDNSLFGLKTNVAPFFGSFSFELLI